MPSIHKTPLYTCFSSYNSYLNQYQSSKNKQAPKQCTASPNPSLRLRGLAQAKRARSGEPLSPRRGLEKGSRSTYGISLRRDPSRLGEMLARSKRRAGCLGDLSRRSPRRAPCFISPRRDWLAWARFTGLATGSSGTARFSNQPNIQNVLTHQIERLSHTSSNQLKHRPKWLETKNSNFPYREGKYEASVTKRANTAAQGRIEELKGYWNRSTRRVTWKP